jgi:hypothetical protein
MASVFKGYNGVTRNRERFTWSKTDGWQSEVTYEGSRANILAISGNVSLWADDLSIDADGPTATLIARVGRDVTGAADNAATDVTTSWNLQSNEVQRDLREATVVRGLSETQIVAVERAATNAKAASEAATAASFIDGSWNTTQKNLFWFFVRDQFNFLDHEFVLSKTELVTSYYTVGVSMAGVNRLWTPSQITAAEGSLPDAMAASVTSIASNTTPSTDGDAMPNDSSNYWRYRWLKKAPNITQTSGGKFERSTEWWLALWPTWLYPVHS